MELLLGFDRDGSVTTWSGQSRRVKFCQVYDAPDPGEGWRLVDVEKEKGEVGDETLVDDINNAVAEAISADKEQ